jgi:hypothetical protein
MYAITYILQVAGGNCRSCTSETRTKYKHKRSFEQVVEVFIFYSAHWPLSMAANTTVSWHIPTHRGKHKTAHTHRPTHSPPNKYSFLQACMDAYLSANCKHAPRCTCMNIHKHKHTHTETHTSCCPSLYRQTFSAPWREHNAVEINDVTSGPCPHPQTCLNACSNTATNTQTNTQTPTQSQTRSQLWDLWYDHTQDFDG